MEKEMATHSSILAWKIPGTKEPSGLLSMGSHRVGHEWSDLAAAASLLRNTMPSLWHATIIPDNPCHKYWHCFPHLQLCFTRFLSFPFSCIISECNLLMISSLLQPPSLMVTLVIIFHWLSSETINLGNPPDNHHYPSTKFHWTWDVHYFTF